MNIHVALFDGKPIQFWETVIGTCGGCIALFLVLLGWGKKKKILALHTMAFRNTTRTPTKSWLVLVDTN
uniref:Magnesium transporter n=1 Tax=Salix viminalis TaxID=40686 RepID=A0A6N2N9Z6_SALVM